MTSKEAIAKLEAARNLLFEVADEMLKQDTITTLSGDILYKEEINGDIIAVHNQITLLKRRFER